MASNLDDLFKNIELAESGLSAPGFDLNKYFLPDEEIAKNILMEKNPKLNEGDADLMIYGVNSDSIKKSESLSELGDLPSQGDTPNREQIIRESIDDSIENLENTGIPIPKSDPLYDEVRERKLNLREKTGEFVRKVLELLKEVGMASIGIVQSVPGAILMLSPFAFNVPGMITMIINMILTLLGIKSKADDVKCTFTHFRKLPSVCSRRDTETVSGILNGMFKTLNSSVFSLTSKVDNFIETATSSLSSTNDKKAIRQITKKLRELNYLPNNNFNDVDEDDREEVEEILENWKVTNKNSRRNAVKRSQDLSEVFSSLEKASKVNNEIQDLLKPVDPLENETYTGVSNNNIELGDSLGGRVVGESVVYDVELPNGQIIKGVTADELEGLKITYNVIIQN